MKLPNIVIESIPFKLLVGSLKKVHFTKKKVNLFIFIVILIKEIEKDNLIERARAMAFSYMLSIFPAIIFLFTLIPYIPITNLKDQIMISLQEILPNSIYSSVNDTIYEILNIPHGSLMSFGFILALYSATNGIMAMINAFNSCYSSADRRSFFKKLLISLSIILMLSIVLVAAIGINLFMQVYIHYIPVDERIHTGVLYVLKNLAVVSIFYIGLSLIYYFAPAVHKRWSFFSHGSFIATLLILGFTLAFSYYVDHFSSYNKIYGSIGALIGLMLWFYMVSLVLLIGFEINACIEMADKPYYRQRFKWY